MRRPHALSALLLTLAAAAPAAAEAQPRRVAGVVTDSAGRPIIDADVVLGEDLRVRTDSTGRFSLLTAERGGQRLRVRYIGFRPLDLTVNPASDRAADLRVVLQRMPQLLAEVRVTDVAQCERNTLQGFECRRQVGRGVYRDAGEIRAMRPSAWADMLDGIPSLRRQPLMTPDGLDWRPQAPPSTCLVEIYNGEDPLFDGHVRKVPVEWLVTQDVVAIEYYERYADVPENLRRFAWPKVVPSNTSARVEEGELTPATMASGSPCSLLVYWLREGQPRSTRRERANTRGKENIEIIRQPGSPTSIIRRP